MCVSVAVWLYDRINVQNAAIEIEIALTKKIVPFFSSLL